MNFVAEGGRGIAANADQKQPSAASSAAWWPSEKQHTKKPRLVLFSARTV